MSSPHEEEIAVLTAKLNALENESRRILRALQWASKTRLILFLGLLLFVLISSFLFYRLYEDVKNERIAEVRRIITNNPEEFSEPLTKQVMLLAKEQGPYVAEVFRKQAQADSKLYVQAFDIERTVLIGNLQTNLEQRLTESYVAMLSEQEAMLQAEFPVLKDPENMQNVRDNLAKVYDKIGKRYYVDTMKEEMESITSKLNAFPVATPREGNIPLGEQIATEFLELVRLMLVNSEHYVIPDSDEASDSASAKTTVNANPVSAAVSDDSVEKDDDSSADEETGDGESENEDSDDDDKTDDLQ